MTIGQHRVVENADHFQDPIAISSKDDDVPGMSDPLAGLTRAASTVTDVVETETVSSNVDPAHAGAIRVMSEIGECHRHQACVPVPDHGSEPGLGPFQDVDECPFRRTGEL